MTSPQSKTLSPSFQVDDVVSSPAATSKAAPDVKMRRSPSLDTVFVAGGDRRRGSHEDRDGANQ
jgi:hypothetical protein